MKSQTLFARCSLFFGNAPLMVAFTLLSVVLSGAQTVDLAWDPSPDAGVGSYRVHYGTSSRNYSSATNAGLATGLAVQGLSQGVNYYFAVTAVGTNQLESDFSNEISYTVPLPNNTAPTITSIGNQTINEDSTTAAIGFTVGDAETTAGSLVVTRSSSNTSLVPTANVVLGGSGANRTVTVTPVSNASGTAQVTVQVSDGELSSSRQFTLTVNSVNDAPTLATLNNVTVAQDAGEQTVSLSGIGSGAANESQTLTVTASSSNPSLISTPSVTYTSPSSTGSIRFTPAAGQNGSAQVTVTVSDNGGTANGGVNSFQRSFTVNVIESPNASPTMDSISDVTIVQAEGEGGLNLGAMGAGTTIWAVAPVGDDQTQVVNLTGIGTGGESSQTLAVTATSSNPTLIPPPTVTYSSPATTGSLTLSPPAGSTGSAVITVTVTDDGGGADTVQRSFTVNVAPPANTAPVIASGSSQIMYEDTDFGPFGVGVSDAQTPASSLILSATSGNTELISGSGLTVEGTGSSRSLRIQPQSNRHGKAMITLSLADAGGAVANRSFWVTVVPINDAPTLNAVADVALTGDQVETVSLAGIGVGPLDGMQGMTVQASSSNPSIVPNPEVVYYSPGATAELQLAPTAGASGSATVTVTVKDDGGTANGGQDTRTRSFTVTTAPLVASASAASTEAGTVQSATAASVAAPQAVLQISMQGEQVVLSWNGAAGPYVLQRSTGFDAGADWVDVDALPESVSGSMLQVTIEPERPTEFFRLASGL